MPVLSELEPRRVFYYFENICSIPHGSGHTKQISDSIVSFAKEHNLRWRQDDSNNVIIWKDATAGYEACTPVMIQGHIDMVCEKEAGCTKDMETEGLDLFIEGDTVGARGTTLGGDDGIAAAIALAILESDTIPHGPLECVFTTDEEVGMGGASALDTSDLRAGYLLNLDSEEEKVFTVSSAGGAHIYSRFPVEYEEFEGYPMELTVSGLAGGHSGEEIHKGRANAIAVLGRALCSLLNDGEFRLVSISGGTKDNAIPREASAILRVSDPSAAKKEISELDSILKNEYHTADGDIQVSIRPVSNDSMPLSAACTRKISVFILCVPNGVQAMSADVDGLVQTSSNIGRVFMKEDNVVFSFMPRSSINSQRDKIVEQIRVLTEILGGTAEITSSYSAWEFRPDSPLRETMIEAFRKVYGEEPVVAALHAGLECGILSGKMPALDCISFGPDLTDIHTPRERLHIASVERLWNLTLETLRLLR